jgi:NTE family protein
MLATSALPLLCKSHKIDGSYHRDGGIKDNSPVKPLVYAEKCKEIFVIHLDAMKENIDKSLYPDTTIYEIVPHRYLGGLLSGTINFSTGHINELFNAGYENTIALLERTVNTIHQQQKAEQIRIKQTDIKNRQLQSAQEIIALIDSVL